MGLAAPPEYFCRRQSGQHPGCALCAVLRSRLGMHRHRLRKKNNRLRLMLLSKKVIQLKKNYIDDVKTLN